MLITCPECKNQISDQSTICVYCGYPLRNIKENICTINNMQYDLSQELQMITDGIGVPHVIRSLRQKCYLSLNDAKRLYDIINDTKEIPNEFRCNEIYSTVSSNIPKCPTCNSTDLKKISGLSKAASVAMWGVLSQKVKKTFHCNSCGYEW